MNESGLEDFKRNLFDMFDIIRVNTKAPGEKADVSEYIHKDSAAKRKQAESIHKDFAAKRNQAEFGRRPHAGRKAVNRSQLLAANRRPGGKYY